MNQMLIGDPDLLVRTVVVGVLAYVALLLLLRLSGKRTLSKMNAFDLVVTVAMGSTLATILMSSEVSLLRGVLALGLLVALQFLITWTSVRVPWVRRFVTGEPTVLVRDGQLLRAEMKKARVTEEEILAAVREVGESGLEGISAVRLETDGMFSVIPGRSESRPGGGP